MKIKVSERNPRGRKYVYLKPESKEEQMFVALLSKSGLPEHQGGFYTGNDEVLIWNIERSPGGNISELTLVFR